MWNEIVVASFEVPCWYFIVRDCGVQRKPSGCLVSRPEFEPRPPVYEPGVLPTQLVNWILYSVKKKASAELRLHVYACNVKRLITPDSLNSICIQNLVTASCQRM